MRNDGEGDREGFRCAFEVEVPYWDAEDFRYETIGINTTRGGAMSMLSPKNRSVSAGGIPSSGQTEGPTLRREETTVIERDPSAAHSHEAVFELRDVAVAYGAAVAVEGVDLDIREREITAFIGPSGCGKSTVLRVLNRMNDLIDSARVTGDVHYHGVDLYDPAVSPVEVRRRIGMVFQKPTPFPKSIYDNVAFGPRVVTGNRRAKFDELVEKSLRESALWDEVKDRLQDSALGLSGGQQQRLSIARALATQPDVLLMDEPCSSLDPIATGRIEELMEDIKAKYTIVIVTHNMQQAARVSDRTAFFTTVTSETDALSTDDHSDRRTGHLVEYDQTATIFANPSDRRTEQYITGRVG